jgi:hypothetical protein
MKESSGGDESKYDIFTYYKKFVNPPLSTTIKDNVSP